MATVIVPAHNEASVIEDCLNSIINQSGIDNIIVACNGCTDNTVEIVTTKFPSVTCLDIEKPSKTNALNVAEEKAKALGISYPIFYIDADTQLSENAIQHISQVMDTGDVLLSAPTPIIKTDKSSFLVKTYYKVWTNLPYIKEGVIATCSFIVSEEGRQRFDKFADVIGDDGYIRCHFKNKEIANIKGAEIYITAPKDIFSLIKIKTRARLGNMELIAKDKCPVREEKHYGNVMKERLFSKNFFSTSIYIAIALIIRVRANAQFKKLSTYTWEKDTSSR
ncbi:glycosyltransferase family 2 protein [Cocleimonas sp. KMM 6892]|uniref:glycosyltransferase n=1 Tax=unclassified Cocleimonas TaxID=2639732 RepID=UPI002DBC369B|nr:MULTISPECIES: glycosyltransferase family 2 protein [unclassified Cocleimonas]MEB8431800.1 glycosyltransferase family 2 protein [Cocleimonas sp. KMM 6892]MEC4715114.1 glycosyltransferase family 2 protein [Cocleimonas sp. KMM 6895]MEC4744072.1 glycosyltransferase family 2 protein [Cocleimonas sp. KMM 6896]